MEHGAIVFGIANVITNLLLVGAIRLLAGTERGYAVRIDSFLATAPEETTNIPASTNGQADDATPDNAPIPA